MGTFVNSGNAAFQVALNSEIYVDKTGLLNYTNRVMDTTSKFICNSRPRRFGKSITADMLTAYYSKGCDSSAMFADLDIGKSTDFQKHLNQYDVIHLDVQWCLEPAGGAECVLTYIAEQTIKELRAYYPEELTESITSLPEALSRINTATGKKFVVIIDEWDVLIRDEAANKKVQEEYINFLRGLFKGTEPTKYIQLAYLTGILPIKKVKTQSALNNFDEFTMLDAKIFADYTGFTEQEVLTLCKKYDVDFDEVKHWYDGYLLRETQVYNPKAVVEILKWKQFQSYWSDTSSYEVVVPLINMDFDGLKTAIIEMLSGVYVNVNVKSFQNDTVSFANKDDVLTYMIHLGYLGYNQSKRTVEAGMGTKLVVYRLSAWIGYSVVNLDAVLSQRVSQFQLERKGIAGASLWRICECKSCLLRRQNRDSKVCVPAETMLGNGVSFAVQGIFAITAVSDRWKQKWGAAFPVRRIPLPDIFGIGCVFQRNELCPDGINLCCHGMVC